MTADVLLDTQYGYDARGLLVLIWLPNGEKAVHDYDALGRLRRLEWDRPDASKPGQRVELARFEYTVDDAGHRTKVIESINGVGRTIEKIKGT